MKNEREGRKQGGWFEMEEGRERREKGERKKHLVKMVHDNCIFTR